MVTYPPDPLPLGIKGRGDLDREGAKAPLFYTPPLIIPVTLNITLSCRRPCPAFSLNVPCFAFYPPTLNGSFIFCILVVRLPINLVTVLLPGGNRPVAGWALIMEGTITHEIVLVVVPV